MAQKRSLRVALCSCGAAGVLLPGQTLRADDASETREQLRLLQQQNQSLQEQLRQQQTLIESLNRRVNEIQQSGAQQGRELQDLSATVKDTGTAGKNASLFSLGKVNLSGEGGVAFFNSGSEGMFPHSQFRIDEARLFVEAPVMEDVYIFNELELATRENADLTLQVGELYLDFENVSRLWHSERTLNLRVGRMYTPFGEEYQTRYAIDNPLISHSLSDLWSVDEGLELYGQSGKFCYALAVQNGGLSGTQDFNSDMSVAGRVGFDPTPWLHVSASGMRTGDLDARGDFFSAIWFGNGFFRSLGSPGTTKFHAELGELDAEVRLPHGQLRAFGGYVHYGDNDPAGQNQRDVYYYSVEGIHDLVGKFYGGVRFSEIFADKGFPVVGNGGFDDYMFGPLTREIWRLSLGLGYRWNRNLVLKAEYTLEQGKVLSGTSRTHEDLFAVEAAFKF